MVTFWIAYVVLQIVGLIVGVYKSDDIVDSLDEGISLLHLIVGLIFLPVVILAIIATFITAAFYILFKFLSEISKKLNNIKIYKFKEKK